MGGCHQLKRATLSPDGTKVAFIQTTQDMRLRALFDLGEMELHSITKEDPYLSHSATRLQILESSIEFLRLNNPPD